jgi:hypothetical protein
VTAKTAAGILRRDETWSDDISVTGDVYVPAGRRLVVEGAAVDCSLRPDPRALSPRPHAIGLEAAFEDPRPLLLVEGELVVEGTAGSPARFGGAQWGGIVVFGRGRATLRGCESTAPVRALAAADFARVRAEDSAFLAGRIAAAGAGFSRMVFERCFLEGGAEAALAAGDDSAVAARGCLFVATSRDGAGASARANAALTLEACRSSGGRIPWAAREGARLTVPR